MYPRETELLTSRQQLRAAWAFAAEARRALAAEGLSLLEWLLLEALVDLRDPMREGVPQVWMARYVGASERVVSHWLAALHRSGRVSKDVDESARAWSVCITQEGEAVLARCRARLLSYQQAPFQRERSRHD